MDATEFEIKSEEEYNELVNNTRDLPLGVMITIPSCGGCNHFKKKNIFKVAEELKEICVIKTMDHTKFEKFLGKVSTGCYPTWRWFAVGKMRHEVPGVDGYNTAHKCYSGIMNAKGYVKVTRTTGVTWEKRD